MIKTTVLKKATQTRDVLISVSIFKMKTPYSNFIKYEINLSKFIREGPQFANIRIYVDDTTEYLVERYKNFSYVEFVKFEYSPLKLSKGHYGTFGTLVRFMPLFYWPSGYKYVWVSDIDINVYLGLSYSYIEEMKNANLLYASLIYYPKPWIENEYNIINYRLISDTSFAPTVFTSFLKDIEGPLQDKIKQIIEYDNKSLGYRKFMFDADEKCPYGIDELFTNKYLFDHLKTLNLKVLVFQRIDISKIIKELFYQSKESQEIISGRYIELEIFQAKIWSTNKENDLKLYEEYIEFCLTMIKDLQEKGITNQYMDTFKELVKKPNTNAGIHHVISVNSNLLI